jgi:hypothetical protein
MINFALAQAEHSQHFINNPLTFHPRCAILSIWKKFIKFMELPMEPQLNW